MTLIQFLVHGFVPALYTSLGAFLELITVNCIILGRAEMFACKNNPLASILDGAGMGLGFTLALFLRYTIPVLTKMRYRLFKQISHLCTLIRIEQRESLEIPRCLERVPILRRDTNYLCNDGFS